VSDLLKLAINEIDELGEEKNVYIQDSEFRLKQHLWQFILKIKSIEENVDPYRSVNIQKTVYPLVEDDIDLNDHPRKKFKRNHITENMSISAPNINSFDNEKENLNPVLYQGLSGYFDSKEKRKNRHSDKRCQNFLQSSNDTDEDIPNQYLMMHLDEYEEEIALIKVTHNISNDNIRCPAPGPIDMLYGTSGIDRYRFLKSDNDSSDS